MIGVIMRYGGDTVEIRVDDSEVVFRTTKFGGQFTNIKGLRLSKSGVIKEFPDLKNNPDWRNLACMRFRKKMKKMKSEEDRINYIIKDLSKFGYVPLYLQKKGNRPIKI